MADEEAQGEVWRVSSRGPCPCEVYVPWLPGMCLAAGHMPVHQSSSLNFGLSMEASSHRHK